MSKMLKLIASLSKKIKNAKTKEDLKEIINELTSNDSLKSSYGYTYLRIIDKIDKKYIEISDKKEKGKSVLKLSMEKYENQNNE